jgi:chemotaxis protein histidine kinase CheA
MSAPATGAIDKVALLEVFLIEARECLLEMAQALRSLQSRGGDAGEIERLYRSVRVIAGNAPSVGLPGAAALARALQGVLRDVRARALPFTEVLAATLRCSVERLRDMLPPADAYTSLTT